LTSSNGTSRKSRTYTWIAGLSALATIGLLSVLLWKVNELESEFGVIRDDRKRIETALASDRAELESLASRRDSLRTELVKLEDDAAAARAAGAQLDGLQTAVEEARTQLAALRDEAQSVRDTLARQKTIEAQLAAMDDALRQDVERRDKLESEINEFRETQKRAGEDARKAESARDEMQADRDRLAAEREPAGRGRPAAAATPAP
jgi:chromosome segregation ATPase